MPTKDFNPNETILLYGYIEVKRISKNSNNY